MMPGYSLLAHSCLILKGEVKKEKAMQNQTQGTLSSDLTPKNSHAERFTLSTPVFLPDSCCVICGKSIAEVGGRRITAQKFRGIMISNKYLGGGNPAYPYKSCKLNSSSTSPLYLVTWGELSMWSKSSIQRAIEAFHKGKRSWFCQICGRRVCSTCGAPINHPVLSDVLNNDGSNPHCGMIPCDPGCKNPSCTNYK